MKETMLKGRGIVEGRCKARALVSTRPLGFLGGVDPKSGTVTEKDHDLLGKSIRNKVLCFPHGHGSTVGSYVLYSLARNNLAPKAIVNQTADPVVVVGAIIADIPMIVHVDITQIRTDDMLEVDSCNGSVRILKRGES